MNTPTQARSIETAVSRLVREARRGDREAWARLFEVHAPMIHSILLARVPRADVGDLLHDVFESALRSLEQLREPEAFPSWLATIARNRAVAHLRSNPSRRSDDDPDTLAGRDAPHEALEVLFIIRELPETYAETLVMRFVEGMTGPEIAARTGLTHGSVRVNLSRGMKLLRARLALRGKHE